VSAPTGEGVLYEIDMRLRPSGNKGPVATHIAAFRKYQRTEAEIWEHMALTRARVIAGDADFAGVIEADIAGILGTPLVYSDVAREARQMRALIEKEKPPADEWDLKLVLGGLIDLEFIAQVALLTGRVDEAGRSTATAEVLRHLANDFADLQVRGELFEAHRLYTTLTQIMRLCLTGNLDPADIPPGLSDLLIRSADAPDLNVLRALLKDTTINVRKLFDILLGQKSASR
jgi:glutamate-ammonia-ligase adenylyltransferase